MDKLKPYEQGEWDMFELITSVWYGKRCYFLEDNGLAYSRLSHKTMTREEAVREFLDCSEEDLADWEG